MKTDRRCCFLQPLRIICDAHRAAAKPCVLGQKICKKTCWVRKHLPRKAPKQTRFKPKGSKQQLAVAPAVDFDFEKRVSFVARGTASVPNIGRIR